MTERTRLDVSYGWEGLLAGTSRHRLEMDNLFEFLPKQLRFAGKARKIDSTELVDWAALNSSHSALAVVGVQSGAASDAYLLPLALALGDAGDKLEDAAPHSVVGPVVSGETMGLLHDGVFDDQTCATLFSLIENSAELQTQKGRICATRGAAFQNILASSRMPLSIRLSSAEQSNTSILYGDRFILKLFRRLESGVNPDAEIGRYLTEHTSFDPIPPFAGLIEYCAAFDDESQTLAMLQGFVANEGDGWKWTLGELDGYYEKCATRPFPETETIAPAATDLSQCSISQLTRDQVGVTLMLQQRLDGAPPNCI